MPVATSDGLKPSMLPPYRVLDLTLGVGHLCGKVLADMGADVIKVEPPDGDPARRKGLLIDGAGSWWHAYNTSKRGITLDLDRVSGRDVFKALVGGADFVIESYTPGMMDRWGLGWRDLSARQPSLVMTSITAFGQTGPLAAAPANDLTLMAMGGFMGETGYPDRGPVRIGVDQGFLHAGAHAAAATLTAHLSRAASGHGRYVDVSALQAIAEMFDIPVQFWVLEGKAALRMAGARFGRGTVSLALTWACKDGYVLWRLFAGVQAGMIRKVVKWMDDVGFEHALGSVPWEKVDVFESVQSEIDGYERELGRFFRSMTKAELLAASRQRNIMLYPVNTPEDVVREPQMVHRRFFSPVPGDEGGGPSHPGPFWRASATVTGPVRPAPSLGEHNIEVYCGELGLSRRDLAALRVEGAI